MTVFGVKWSLVLLCSPLELLVETQQVVSRISSTSAVESRCRTSSYSTVNSSMFRLCFDFPQIDWAANIRKAWDFSEEGAHARLEAFLGDGEPFLTAPFSLPAEERLDCGAGVHLCHV